LLKIAKKRKKRMYIYSIRCKTNDNVIQIGSTKQTLNKRWICHKAACKKKNTPLYKYIRENGGIENFYIELYEEIKNCTKQELEKREGEIMRELKKIPNMVVLNHNIAGNTQGLTEYDYKKLRFLQNQEYKERQNELVKKWLKDPKNAEKMKIYQKEYQKEYWRKNNGYYDRHPSDSSSEKENETDTETDIDTRYDLIPDN
jgi:hypothetical protein